MKAQGARLPHQRARLEAAASAPCNGRVPSKKIPSARLLRRLADKAMGRKSPKPRPVSRYRLGIVERDRLWKSLGRAPLQSEMVQHLAEKGIAPADVTKSWQIVLMLPVAPFHDVENKQDAGLTGCEQSSQNENGKQQGKKSIPPPLGGIA